MSYSNTSSQPRPAVVVVPDYDGIGNYERWRADLLASLGYVGADNSPELPHHRQENSELHTPVLFDYA